MRGSPHDSTSAESNIGADHTRDFEEFVHHAVHGLPDVARPEFYASLSGEHLAETMSLGVRTWGPDPDGPTVMLVGAYESLGEISERLLRALPPSSSSGPGSGTAPSLNCSAMRW